QHRQGTRAPPGRPVVNTTDDETLTQVANVQGQQIIALGATVAALAGDVDLARQMKALASLDAERAAIKADLDGLAKRKSLDATTADAEAEQLEAGRDLLQALDDERQRLLTELT